MILKRVLDTLVCPVAHCRKPLTLSEDGNSLECTGCRRIYPIEDDIPVLFAEQPEAPEKHQ
jgi:uncharacterized protein YbaR (Trm112 family)